MTLKVKRYNPEATSEDKKSYFQEYKVDAPADSTVLDSLIQIREYQDESLTLRCSCRGAICGSCAMRVNGHAGLMCKTKVEKALGKNNVILVEPMGNQPVVKDLVVDMSLFFDKVRAVEPYLQPVGPEPKEERIASNEDMLHLVGVMSCIMCGACVSDCTVLEMDPNFLGPAALAKAYRFVADPRDGKTKERITEYNKYGGIWDCTRCMECVQVCPKGVDPMGRIMMLRTKADELGTKDYSYGVRHADAFEDSVKKGGKLNEAELVINTFGFFNVPKLLGMLPVAMRAAYKRKMPSLFHKSIPGVQSVRRIMSKAHEVEKVQGKKPMPR
ncbi:MAG: succinate dehydrogenase/fumarate reductase iron-sulfur subunit [Dehalococcoidia bacterium]|nr:succinate dehydrogenase/fumarate reductase iron-sulfur subunit [Dehalococcoidia bacterium]